MGATAISDGVVNFRYHCKRCDVLGDLHADQSAAESDLHGHWSSWHYLDGEPIKGEHHWYWHCHACMRTVDEFPEDSEAAARYAGYSHWLSAFHHQGEFVIEQLGTYPENYDAEQGYCGPEEDQTEAPDECSQYDADSL